MANNKLSAVKVESLTKVGTYSDGDGLYFDIPKVGNKRWIFRYQLNKKRRILSLGIYHKKINSLAIARTKALEARALISQGIDPIDHKREQERLKIEKEKKAQAVKNVEAKTFKVCAKAYIKSMQAEWTNEKHIQQWTNTLDTYAYPFIGDIPVKDIEVEHIRLCLDPIWSTKTETASRVRQRIESVIGYAIASKYRTASNPAIWKGLLDKFYPKPEKVKKKRRELEGKSEHFDALPYSEIPKFMVKLRKLDGFAAQALRFTILTASRTGEIRFAVWDEFDLDKKEWTIPKNRMKAGREHRVALPDAAVTLLKELPRINDYVFPGWKTGQPLSNGGMLSVLKRMKRQDITVHGFRSTFRDYIGEETGFPFRLAEFALAHQLKDGAEKAYARGDMLKKRFAMMNAWAEYVDSLSNGKNVVHINRRVQG